METYFVSLKRAVCYKICRLLKYLHTAVILDVVNLKFKNKRGCKKYKHCVLIGTQNLLFCVDFFFLMSYCYCCVGKELVTDIQIMLL